MIRRNTLLVAASFLLPILLTSVTGLFATEPIGAFEQGSRVLFQGDSITDGNRSGHQIMADEWERTVREFWPKSP